ncbi:MAG: hypothetical protein HOB84_15245 [Candidatus Marinimicrobia bacterium]|nr:hypothetical protein [Candidatus Neomarinimicrobiota bacterium]MBT4362661.1 hypothetical protein [Candidatus Neomarinimicrobiota bacterium]MBT4716124.1 hypothetical protein [Candidatus Neomarinimicrobiota bacterium]MBT4947188.1 hypothetical protein [Candidatus Neomarinimicrobiota bacterium]MBT5268550.1 hypothetical protein [Candidatus Neomarinimicrobiota bacterium]
MKKTWEYTAIFTLILIGMMQAVPFLPTHTNCQAVCCVEAVSCCETQVETECDMAMTSCNVTLFVPLISAPLIKVDSNISLDIASAPVLHIEVLPEQFQVNSTNPDHFQVAPPPDHTPLLI